jgi:hypothetical protein
MAAVRVQVDGAELRELVDGVLAVLDGVLLLPLPLLLRLLRP